MKVLNRRVVNAPLRPVRVFQFGEGNFLRAFVDWQIDVANEKGVLDTGVAVATPLFDDSRVVDILDSQDGLYHVVLEGVQDGQPKREIRLVTAVQDVFNPAAAPDRYDSYICSPHLRFVVSNTTEAGIRYEADDVLSDTPRTFPGKVVNFLYRRYRHFNGDPAKGLIFLCCELIEDNGTHLHQYVVRHAREAGLEQGFIDWVDNACIFCDTLVDRIVPGFPRDTIDEIKQEIGYDDNAVDKGEYYHLWAIGGKDCEKVRAEMPLDQAGLHVIFLPSIKPYRDKKVRILNGSHTGLVAMSLLLGHQTVLEAFRDERVNSFVNRMVSREVLPMIDEDPQELQRFADGILERFYNPYVKHMLGSIALNSLSKWEARNYPTVKDNWQRAGRLAEYELFTFAALLALYAPGSGFTPDDTAEHVAFIREHWDDGDLEGTVAAITSSGIFLERFGEQIPGFNARVAEYLSDIRNHGMASALEKFLVAQP